MQIVGTSIFNQDYLPERCGLDCGPHGACESGRCVCAEGWEGDRCGVRLCDDRCKDHGVCSNGTCLCTNGEPVTNYCGL